MRYVIPYAIKTKPLQLIIQNVLIQNDSIIMFVLLQKDANIYLEKIGKLK